MKKALYKLAPNVLLQKVADEMVLLNPADGQYYGVNEIGARIIELMSHGTDISSIARQLLEEYDVERTLLEQDIQDLIDKLQQHALIESVA